jgi:hypothetical protein
VISISTADYIIQGIIALLIFVHPWFLRPGQGGRAFGFPFLAICAWGFWRVFDFDPATHNDVPGIGYFVAAVPYSLIALLFFKIRCAILRRRTTHNEPGNA